MTRDPRHTRLIAAYSLGIATVGWLLLLLTTPWDAWRANLWPILMFAGLSCVIKGFGFHVTREVTQSLVGIVDLAAVFVLGPEIGGWVAAVSGLVYLELYAARRRSFSWHLVGEHPLFSGGLRAMMAMACGHFYLGTGGSIPLKVVTWEMLVPLLATFFLWFLMDQVAWGLRAYLREGRSGLTVFLRQTLSSSVLIGLLPLPLSVVIALSYLGMGTPAFVLLSLALVASGAMLQGLTQALTRLETRAAELAVLNDLGRALVEAQLDIDQLCELAHDYAHKVVDTPLFTLELLQPQLDQVGIVLHVQDGVRQPHRTVPMTEMLKWMADKREIFLSNDLAHEELPFTLHLASESAQSLVIVPLLAGPQLIGAFSMQSYVSHAFDQDQVNTLAAIAHQVAMAIANARVYQAEQRRAKQLTAISQVSQRVAAILDLDQLFADVVALIQQTFGYDHVGIFTVDADSDGVTFRASTNPLIQEQGLAVTKGEGIIAWVAQFGEPIIANDVSKEPRYCATTVLADTKAELAVPLKVENRIVGVLDVQSNSVDAFGQEDLFVLQTLAAQVAIAVEDARLYAARQEEAWTSTALLQVAEAVGNLDKLDEILETVVRITPMLAGVDRCSILLWDEDRQEFATAQVYTRQREMTPLFEGAHFRPGEAPLLDELRATRLPLSMQGDANESSLPADLVQGSKIGNLLALPLRAQGEIHGAMLVDNVDPRAGFSERKRTILAGIADQAAMAIANARLHDAQHEEAWVSTALLQVAQALAASTDLSDNISKIARLTPLLAGVDRCMVFLWEKEEGVFVPFEAHGLSKEAGRHFSELRLKPGDVPLLEEIMQRQSYVIVENAATSTLIPPSMLRDFDIQSVMAVPLTSRGETLGALLVDYTQGPRSFSARKISIIEGIALQTAIAIENTRLYEASLQQERVTQELRLAHDIQVSFLPESAPRLTGWEIAADWHAAREVGGDFYDFIPLGRDRLGLVIADVSDKGVPAALFMSLSRTLMRASAAEIRSPAKTMQRVNELIMTETRSGMFVTVFYGVLNWRTGRLIYASAGHNPPMWWRRAQSQIIPLLAKGIVLGVVEDITLEEREITLEAGDTLVLYTDGVTEPTNAQTEEFGEERLMQVIASASDKSCTELVSLIRSHVLEFTGDQPAFDDYTLVGIKRQLDPHP